MTSITVLRCGCALILTILLIGAAAQEVPCTWSSRTIDANDSIINITVPAIGTCPYVFVNTDVFYVKNYSFVGLKSGETFPYLPEEVDGTPALRILIENATDVDFLYLICTANGIRHAVTIGRDNYTERINARNAYFSNYFRSSINKTGPLIMESVRSMKLNLDILIGLETSRPINEDFCAKGENVSMTWTFPRDINKEHELSCRSSNRLLCSNPKRNDAIDECHLEQNGEFVTYNHIAKRSDEKTLVYNCVLNGSIITTKVVHWQDAVAVDL